MEWAAIIDTDILNEIKLFNIVVEKYIFWYNLKQKVGRSILEWFQLATHVCLFSLLRCGSRGSVYFLLLSECSPSLIHLSSNWVRSFLENNAHLIWTTENHTCNLNGRNEILSSLYFNTPCDTIQICAK